jgi:hypothetical protein
LQNRYPKAAINRLLFWQMQTSINGGFVMQSSNQERSMEVTRCEMCGDGYTPDERMRFSEDVTAAKLIQRAYDVLEEIQTRVFTIECLMAKALEMNKAEQWQRVNSS